MVQSYESGAPSGRTCSSIIHSNLEVGFMRPSACLPLAQTIRYVYLTLTIRQYRTNARPIDSLKMPYNPAGDAEDFQFIMLCIKHSDAKLQPDHDMVAKEMGIEKKATS